MNGGACARSGFTLVELIAVIVIVAVLSSAATLSLSGTVAARERAAARQVARDLSYARERALATGVGCWIVINPSVDQYQLRDDDPSNPGRNGATAITDPATGHSFTVDLNTGPFAGVRMTSVAVSGGGSDLGFDGLGRPQNGAGARLTTVSTLTLSGGRTVSIAPHTGFVSSP